MKLLGTNERYEDERTRVADDRCAGPVEKVGEPFPRGVAGLIPVATDRAHDGERVVYAFPVREGDQRALDAAAALAARAAQAACGTADGQGPAAPTTGGDEPEVRPVIAALADAVALVNRMLDQAAELSKHPFGIVDGVRTAVREEGYGFANVSVAPRDAHGDENPLPTQLRVETSARPGSPDTLSALVEYDVQGTPGRVTLTEFGPDAYVCRAVASVNEKSGKLSLYKVEERTGDGRTHLLYKRGWQHASASKTTKEGYYPVGGRPTRRGPAGGHTSGARGGAGGRDRRDRRGPRRFGDR